MKIHVGIVADRRREAMALKLADDVGADFISWDAKNSATGNHRAAWNWHYAHPSDWAITLEDDAVPCKNFRTQAAKALAVAPRQIVSLYLGQQRPTAWQSAYEWAIERAEEADAHWMLARHVLHAVGLAADRDAIKAMVQALTLYGVYEPDAAVGAWTARNGVDVAYSWPSLVDHADGLNLIHHHEQEQYRPGRVAWRHGTRRKWNSISVPLVAPKPAPAARNNTRALIAPLPGI